MEVGSLTELLAGIISAGISLFALFLSIRANRKADENEKELERKRLAATVYAYWVQKVVDEENSKKNAWGLFIVNTGGERGLVANVEIKAESFWVSHNKPCIKDPIKLNLLPPGHYFVLSHNDETWGRPCSVSDWSEYEPVMSTERWKVRSIAWGDIDGTKRCWKPEDGVTDAE
ncbi:hypothetical protein [Propionimicrobium lymphophilum]|uniref:hypothetical protein n=1 Tax=Propionimicrobium lymphophilum TaxID=33012 RepID=UPI00048C5238|nr:hypothetical protein [Propionimicrobium lymphophilum]